MNATNKNQNSRGIYPVDISTDIYYVRFNEGLAAGYPIDEIYLRGVTDSKAEYYACIMGGYVDWVSTTRPKGEYIMSGLDRDGAIQWCYDGTGETIFIGSVFTFGFLGNREEGGAVSYGSISWENFDQYRSKFHINFMGHKSTADLVDMDMCRLSIKAQPGDVIVWSQYDGPRLEEGSTTLPEGAKLVPMEAKIYGSKIRAILEDIKRWFK